MENNRENAKIIGDLLQAQEFAVLSTESGGQPYASLVAVAVTGGLRGFVFVTGRNTRKYASMRQNHQVALLIDSRRGRAAVLSESVAVTVLGEADEADPAEKEGLSRIYLAKHPSLGQFLHHPDNALMKVAVRKYILATFNTVRSLDMADIAPYVPG